MGRLVVDFIEEEFTLNFVGEGGGGDRLLEFDPRTSLDPFPLVGRVNCEKKPWILDPTC